MSALFSALQAKSWIPSGVSAVLRYAAGSAVARLGDFTNPFTLNSLAGCLVASKYGMRARAYVHVCLCACVRVCVRACVRARVCVSYVRCSLAMVFFYIYVTAAGGNPPSKKFAKAPVV